jgi:uncharacterized membrane protein
MKSLYWSFIILLTGCGGGVASEENKQGENPQKTTQTRTIEPVAASGKVASGDSQVDPLPTYEWLNTNVFSTRCVACHNAANSNAGVDLSSFESILGSTRFPKLIEPLFPNESLVIRVIQANSMPPGKEKLNESEKLALNKWIETGARKSENDPIPTPIPTPTEPPD